MLIALARERILTQELSSIEEHLGRNNEAYYRILAQVGNGARNSSNDARPWVHFCLEAHYVQAENVLRRIQKSDEVWIKVEKLRRQNRLPERVTAALFDATIGLRVRNSSYRTLLRNWDEEISNQVATTNLRAMVDAGLLQAHGRNRGAYYDAANPLLDIRTQARHSRRPIDTSTLFNPADQ